MKIKTITIGISLLFAGLIIGRFLLPNRPEQVILAADSTTLTAVGIWTCSMHPQIQQPSPGDCPICGMDLIPLPSDAMADAGPRELSMSENSRALADIQTVEVGRAFPTKQVRLVGKLTYDETREKSLTARFPARIEQLFVNYTGVSVAKGEHLAEIYSPELLTAQRELISSHQRDAKSRITEVAREKLRLWDLLPEQIESILSSGQPQDRFEIKAPTSGVVVDKKVSEGDYVKTGEPLFRIVDMSELWLTLNAYESDLFWLRYGQAVSFTVEAYPGETFNGRISFIDPELNPLTRTISIRVIVPNTEQKLKPGMFIRGMVESRITESGTVYAPDMTGQWICPMHPQIIKDVLDNCDLCGMDLVSAESLGYASKRYKEAPVVVPEAAVLRTGKRAVVYVELPNTEHPTYAGREVVLGPKAGDVFIVESGLVAGERVVINGAFKIDSALQIQAKPSMMSVQETRSEFETGGVLESGRTGDMENRGVPLIGSILPDLLPHYFALHTALVGDDLDAAQSALKSMMAVTGHSGPLADLIHTMLAVTDLDGIRRPHFETLSNVIIASVKASSDQLKDPVYLMHCPMVYPDRGANWLQDNEALKNPYFGSMMLGCGEVLGRVGESENGRIREMEVSR